MAGAIRPLLIQINCIWRSAKVSTGKIIRGGHFLVCAPPCVCVCVRGGGGLQVDVVGKCESSRGLRRTWRET